MSEAGKAGKGHAFFLSVLEHLTSSVGDLDFKGKIAWWIGEKVVGVSLEKATFRTAWAYHTEKRELEAEVLDQQFVAEECARYAIAVAMKRNLESLQAFLLDKQEERNRGKTVVINGIYTRVPKFIRISSVSNRFFSEVD